MQWTAGPQRETQTKLASSGTGLLQHRTETLTLAVSVALLKPLLYFFYGRTGGEGTLETPGYNPMQIKITQSPVRVSENSFSLDITRIPLP